MTVTIVSSVITGDGSQVDGRRQISEVHTDSLGVTYLISYLADKNTNTNANLLARPAIILSELSAVEVANNLAIVSTFGVQASPVTIYSTAAANIAALRAVYQTFTQTQAAFTGEYLSSLSDVILQSVFTMTAQQVTNLRANSLTPMAALAAQIRAAVGQ